MTEHDFEIKFFVEGNPKAQARPRLARYGGTYSPKTDWYHKTLDTAIKHKPKKPIDFPVFLSLSFRMPKPKNINKQKVWHDKRPDYDNLAKAVTDAIVKADILEDDNVVAMALIEKKYANKVGCIIDISKLDENLSKKNGKV